MEGFNDMMKPFFLFASLLLAILIPSISHTSVWSHPAPGIEYQDIGSNLLNPWSHIHVFRIDLKENQFDLVLAHNLKKPYASVDEFSQHSQALITLNGGFFDKNHHPLGLRIGHQQLQNPLKRISWWGVFYIKNQIPRVTSIQQFKQDKQIDFALQSGPRLLVDGNIPSLKPGLAERSALGIDAFNHVIVLVTENHPMTTTELAQLMKSAPLDCQYALNLDGGSSSQLNANIGLFQIHVPGFANVSDAIIIKPRNH